LATSNSINYSQNRNELISDALQLLGVIGAGESASANDITFCSAILNKMVKAWEAQGIHLWKESEAIIAVIPGKNKYTLAASNGDIIGDNPVETTLTASASGATLTLSDTTGMTAADNIVITLDDDTHHSTTIVSVDTPTQVTITSAVASVASSGNCVFTYTAAAGRPLNVNNCRYKYNNGIERAMLKMGRSEFMALPNKSMSAPCTAFYYTPQLSNGYLYVYPTPSEPNDTLHISYQKSIQDFDGAADDPDFPQEWLEAITYNLAARVAPAYGLTLSKVNPDILGIAQSSLANAELWDTEEGSVRIVPNNRFDE
jgi:hypothetical protein